MTSKFVIDGDAVRKLAEILVETDLSEIEYEDNGSRIYVSRRPATFHTQVAPNHVVAPSPVMAAAPSVSQETPASTNLANHPGVVKSPMVGTAYLAPEPNAPAFVKVGDTVAVGQTLLIVEAMKVMNQIKAQKSGRITQILVGDARPVEYDEPLMVIE
jgi:acetyl-CoA carboxylase biotin carboxyl carrier protein